jgi:hypothetical protein
VRIHQAQVDNLAAGMLEPRSHMRHLALEPFPKPGKLAPLGIKADAA